jgi:hypothetical protein
MWRNPSSLREALGRCGLNARDSPVPEIHQGPLVNNGGSNLASLIVRHLERAWADAGSGLHLYPDIPKVPLAGRVRGIQNVHQEAEVGEGARVSLRVPSPSNRRMRVLRQLESLLELGVLSVGEVNPPSPWINVFPVVSPFVFDDPVNHLALKGTVFVRKLSRPNLLTVMATGDPYTSLSVRAQWRGVFDLI